MRFWVTVPSGASAVQARCNGGAKRCQIVSNRPKIAEIGGMSSLWRADHCGSGLCAAHRRHSARATARDQADHVCRHLSMLRRGPQHASLASQCYFGRFRRRGSFQQEFVGPALQMFAFFLDDPSLEATNNRAERALRPAVIARKLSCGNKTQRGKRTLEILASLAATCHQRGQDFVETLRPHLTIAPSHLR
jgi:hypothetical protein